MNGYLVLAVCVLTADMVRRNFADMKAKYPERYSKRK